MGPRTDHPAVVHRRRERDGLPVNDRRLRRLLDSGELVRVAAGSYVDARAWQSLAPLDRHVLVVLEVADRARSQLVLSHHAAAALWGIDILGEWPTSVDVRIPPATGGRTSGEVRRWAWGTDDIDLVPWRGHWITTPAQTAVDLARRHTFTRAVVAMDQAQWHRRPGGPLASAEQIFEIVEATTGRGAGRAAAAARFSSGSSDSVRESQSRVVIDALGFPAPVLQQRFVLPSGRVARPDFWFPDFSHAGEFDGVGKYVDPEILRGRSGDQALIEEKDRGDELARVVRRLSRWRVPALRDPRLLYDILTSAGLPSGKPRPRAGLSWT